MANPPTPLVGRFIREKREAVRLSQRALGQLFVPPVTTQFISNIERGVTPLPPVHITTLVNALQITEGELVLLLEQEYAAKISGRAGRPEGSPILATHSSDVLNLLPGDAVFMKKLYDAYRTADSKIRQTFVGICETILNLPKP